MSENRITDFFSRLESLDSPVIVDTTSSNHRHLNGEQVLKKVDQTAQALLSLSDNRAVSVLALVDNSIETCLVLLACMRHGLTVALAPANSSQSYVNELLKGLGPCNAISTSPLAPSTIPKLAFDDLDNFALAPKMEAEPHRELLITFTSGTTSKPKAVVHSANSILRCAESFNDRIQNRANSRYLGVMPMSYMAGIFNSLLVPLQSCSTVVIDHNFSTLSALRFWPLIQEQEIESVWMSPTMLRMVLDLDRRTERKETHQLKKIFVGTAPLSSQLSRRVVETYGIRPLQSYGLSETLFVSVEDPKSLEPASVGRLLDGVHLSYDLEDRIQVSSPFLFLGYLVDGKLRSHSGSFPTSDFGEFSYRGNLRITGRSDDMVVRGGVNISPQAVELLLEGKVGVSTYCVVGLPDEILGQKLCIVFENHHISDRSLEAIRRVVKDAFPNIYLDEACSVKEIPIGPTGKPQRKTLQRILAAGK